MSYIKVKVVIGTVRRATRAYRFRRTHASLNLPSRRRLGLPPEPTHSCLSASRTCRLGCGKLDNAPSNLPRPPVVPTALRRNPPFKPTWESFCAPSLRRLLAALTSFTKSKDGQMVKTTSRSFSRPVTFFRSKPYKTPFCFRSSKAFWTASITVRSLAYTHSAGFVVGLVVAQVSGQNIGRNRRDLAADEDHDQLVADCPLDRSLVNAERLNEIGASAFEKRLTCAATASNLLSCDISNA
jgi:hypothetical protein